MSNSNGMYNVLNIFKKLEPVEQPTAKQQAQAIYESVEARGSILEGVGKIEKKLAEQFAAMKEGEKVKVKGGTVHKGTYGTEYEPGDEGGVKKKEKPKSKTGKRGRPAKEKSAELKTSGGDIFGRTTGKVPKGKKGTVVKGKGHDDTSRNKAADDAFARDDKKVKEAKNPYAVGMAQAMKSTGDKPPLKKSTITKAHHIAKKVKANESKIMEGFNFTEMVKDTDMSVGEMMEALQNDIKMFKETGVCSDTLEAFLKIHNHGKKRLADATIPRGPSFAPQHADIPPVQKPSILDKAKGMVKTGLEKLGHPDDAGMRADLQRKMGIGEELDELARLAGISEAKKAKKDYDGDGEVESEKDEVWGSRMKAAKEAGKMEEAAKPDFRDVDGDGNEKESWKKAEKDKEKDKVDECMSPMGSMASDMEQQEGRISISTNMSSDGNKNVSINADGNAADQLMQMLKMAGLGGGQAHAKLAIAIPTDSGAGEQEVEEATDQYANTPEEEYAGVETITDQGEDMNRQKKQFAGLPRQGDNPMASQQPVAEEVDPIGSLGRDLMKEYQALKLAK